MPLIEWNDNYSVGIETADTHHKKLISMINSLHEAMSKGESNEVITKILSALTVYTDKHFKYEEKLFLTHNYPRYKEHKKEHDELIRQVEDLNEKFKASTTSISIEVMKLLNTWLTDHIQKTDKQYTEFLNSKGVK